MLVAQFIYNHKGLKVHKEVIDNNDKFFNSEILDHIHLTIYSNLKLDFPNQLDITQMKDQENLPTDYFGYYYIYDTDLYFIYTDHDSLPRNIINQKQVIKLIEKRSKIFDFFIGLSVVEFKDDEGPTPIYNNNPLTEEQHILLAVQATTLMGMGQKQMPNYLIGPIPVPMSDYCFLAFAYQRTAKKSKDPRIQNIGRPTLIITILNHIDKVEKELIEFLELFLKHWSKTSIADQEVLQEDDLIRLYDDIHETLFLAKDLFMIRSIQQDEFKHLFRQNFTENLILQTENEDLKAQLEKATGTKFSKTSSKKPKRKSTKKTKKTPKKKKKAKKKVTKKKKK